MEAKAEAKLRNDKYKDGAYQCISLEVELEVNEEPGTITFNNVS
jgi:hypothetical protein